MMPVSAGTGRGICPTYWDSPGSAGAFAPNTAMINHDLLEQIKNIDSNGGPP